MSSPALHKLLQWHNLILIKRTPQNKPNLFPTGWLYINVTYIFMQYISRYIACWPWSCVTFANTTRTLQQQAPPIHYSALIATWRWQRRPGRFYRTIPLIVPEFSCLASRCEGKVMAMTRSGTEAPNLQSLSRRAAGGDSQWATNFSSRCASHSTGKYTARYGSQPQWPSLSGTLVLSLCQCGWPQSGNQTTKSAAVGPLVARAQSQQESHLSPILLISIFVYQSPIGIRQFPVIDRWHTTFSPQFRVNVFLCSMRFFHAQQTYRETRSFVKIKPSVQMIHLQINPFRTLPSSRRFPLYIKLFTVCYWLINLVPI